MLAFLVRFLLWDPFIGLDLVDKHGKPDHGKVMGFLGFLAVFALEATSVWRDHHTLSVGELLMIVAPIFGWVGWRTFLQARTVTSTETVTRAISETIAARRQVGAADGVEPAP